MYASKTGLRIVVQLKSDCIGGLSFLLATGYRESKVHPFEMHYDYEMDCNRNENPTAGQKPAPEITSYVLYVQLMFALTSVANHETNLKGIESGKLYSKDGWGVIMERKLIIEITKS